MAKEYIIYCDESISKGKYYSDFYGGVLISSADLDRVKEILENKKSELNFRNEVKWTRVTENYLEKYIELISTFFEFVKANIIKVRIMFRQTAQEPINLTERHKEIGYFLLYYQFIKHSFGLIFSNPDKEEIYLRLYFDELPDNKEKAALFKNHIYALQSLNSFQGSNIKIRRSDITDVNSKDHILLQCLDIILGAMAFRLNDMHKEIPKGERRGKRTIAKEKLYKHINSQIREFYPFFNIGESTGHKGDLATRWLYPYRHWKFTPAEFKINEDRYK